MEVEVIRSSRWKTALYLVVSMVFVAIGIAMVRDPTADAVKAWLVLVFFGLGALVFAWLMIRPQVLILDGAGFTVDGGLVRSPKRIAWGDIQGFFVYRLPRGGKMIGYNFRPGVRKNSLLMKAAKGFGAEGGLPKGWPSSPEKMAETLNSYRDRALAAVGREDRL